MAEALVKVLIESLNSLIRENVGLILGVDKEIEKLSSTLTTVHRVLEDAENEQFHSEPIKCWLSKLNSIAYEIEDILDECATEHSKQKKHRGGKFKLKKILYDYKIGRRMKEVVEKLDAVAAERHKYHLAETVERQSTSRVVDWRRETGSVVNEPDHIYGRDKEKEKIVDMLVNQVPDCRQQLSVLPIIGVGGIGKTTLAQLVFNDQRVSQHFETRLWVCVSDVFDLKTLLKAMIEFATGRATDLVEYAALERRLCEVLKDKKYLLILDDVWNDNQDAWHKLRSILTCGSIGSSIVVTTRLKIVAEIMKTLPPHYLEELSEEDCWLLFKQRAFGLENEQCPNLETIGREIAKKCAGVPLAAKALGGLLRFKREEREWIHVKESEIWNSPQGNSIMSILRLSYHHLPFVLKRCFVYCAVFPKDSIIKKRDLILHWMAHGCIFSSDDEKREVEDVGDQIWNELVLRSFFQEANTEGGQATCKMHDLVHDLAQSIMENQVSGAQTISSSVSASNSKIREVHWSGHPWITTSSSIIVKVSALTTTMNYNRARILKMDFADMEKLPSAIGKLKHLQYLSLSCTSIHTLPRTFCGLWNLKILNLRYCRDLKSLPNQIRYMTNLRHIFLEGCDSLSHMPSRIRELTSLKTLSLFVVGHNKTCSQLDELELLNIGGELQIRHLERIQNHMIAKKANLVEKRNLRYLSLYWERNCTSELAKSMDNEKVLEALEPHPNLENLEISGFKGSQFPLWMTKMENITEIRIAGCPNCRYLPAMGDLCHLKSLYLSNLAALEYITGEDEIRGQNSVRAKFPSLEHLDLNNLPNLKGCFMKEVGELIMFPNLRSLHISRCQLSIWPPLSTLRRLQAWDCRLLTLSSLFPKLENLSSLLLDLGVIDTATCIPEDALESLCNLKELDVWNADKTRLPEKWFRGLESVAKLQIVDCNIGSCFPEGWLPHLTALEELTIYSCQELVELPEGIKSLHLLKRLKLFRVEDMVSLPQGLQHIPSLQSLTLRELPQLTSLPDWLGSLTSLTRLAISNCPKIPSLPSSIQGMTNLWFLEINGCPDLAQRCEEESGEDWHKIAHISRRQIKADW